MKKHPYTALMAGFFVLFLQGCDNGSDVQAAVQEPKPVVEQVTEKRDYVTEHNFITYAEDSKPKGMPEYHVYKAKEWPREDLDNAASYDKPRIQFFWDNGNSREMDSDAYEKREKIWSMKIDGTDLRLVTDDFRGSGRGELRRSPNNRYLAYAVSNKNGLQKVLFDLKTQTSTILGSSSTLPILVWAEDSSYLYYSNGREYIKYTLATQEKEEVDIRLTPHTVIYKGNRIVVSDFGVAVYRESDNKKLYNILTEKGSSLPAEQKAYEKRAISANGKYAWAKNRYHKVFFDVEKRTWVSVDNKGKDKWKLYRVDNISVNGDEYQQGAARVTLYHIDKDGNRLSYKRWSPIGTGRSATNSSIYNAFANQGRFLEEANK